MDGYITAERRGRDSLRRFLLDLDAKEVNEIEERTIGQVLELYLQVNAHPSNPGGLAPVTYERYQALIRLHMLDRPRGHRSRLKPPRAYAVAFCSLPAVRFNQPRAPSAWRERMLREGVPKSTRKQAWSVLSAVLGWASSQLVGEIETNGSLWRPPRAAKDGARSAPAAPATSPVPAATGRSYRPGRSHPRR